MTLRFVSDSSMDDTGFLVTWAEQPGCGRLLTEVTTVVYYASYACKNRLDISLEANISVLLHLYAAHLANDT